MSEHTYDSRKSTTVNRVEVVLVVFIGATCKDEGDEDFEFWYMTMLSGSGHATAESHYLYQFRGWMAAVVLHVVHRRLIAME